MSKSKEQTFGETATRYLQGIKTKLPSNVQPYVDKATPIIAKVADLIEKAIPFFILAYTKIMEFWEKLSPYHPELLAPAAMGLIMCFFGGSYMTLIAAVEAYRLTGWESTYNCVMDLYHDFQKVADASKKDDAVDDNNDGIPDVQQIDSKELITRKTLLFLKTVDPHRFTNAISGIQGGFLAVVAALKVQFAKAVTLGNAIAEILEVPALRYLVPLIKLVLPAEYERWAEPVIRYTIRSIAVSIAWTLQRVISAFHSALAGGVMATRNIIEYLNIMGHLQMKHEETYIDEIAGYILAAVGFWFQLSSGFQLPFLLSVILFPFTFAEWFLMYMVNRM